MTFDPKDMTTWTLGDLTRELELADAEEAALGAEIAAIEAEKRRSGPPMTNNGNTPQEPHLTFHEIGEMEFDDGADGWT
jgi:hypothetical protein